MRQLAVVVMGVALLGCATPPPVLSTPSGNPEVVIQGVTRKQVVDKIVDAMSARGLTLRTVSDHQVVAGGRAEDFAARFFHGSRYDGVPEYRVTFTMVEQAPGVKVYSRAAIVTNPGSGFERVNDMTQPQGKNIQDMLLKLKRSME